LPPFRIQRVRNVSAEGNRLESPVSCYALEHRRNTINFELYPLIVTLREGTPHKDQLAFHTEVSRWREVVRAGELQSDPQLPEIPPYFVIYVDPSGNRTALIERLRKAPVVAAAEIPPARFIARAGSADRLETASRREPDSSQQT